MAYNELSMFTTTCALPTTGWTNNSITVNCAGVTTSNNIIIAPAPASMIDYMEAGIVYTAQGDGTLTFTRTLANNVVITINVMIFNGGEVIIPDYTITNNASSKVSVDKQQAKPNEIITITGIADDMHQGILLIYNNESYRLSFDIEANRVYTFTMPSFDVEIILG